MTIKREGHDAFAEQNAGLRTLVGVFRKSNAAHAGSFVPFATPNEGIVGGYDAFR